ncbi:MAG: DUF4127 family protein [Candidatus Eremiobacteraeota bacterium]|nr:DUF4127 family protein [Candidatus Eremiobacteraeota bacterium]
MKIAALFCALLVLTPVCAAAQTPSIAFVPLDDRPVTYQLPQMLARIAGVRMLVPPKPMLGRYLRAGRPEDLIAWLNTGDRRRANDYVVSTDMLAYGGLVASRVPGVTYADAINRLRELRHIRTINPAAYTSAFGTIMRLAPTGVPNFGEGKNFFAAYPVWKYLQQYANLHDPATSSEEALATQLATEIGQPTLQAYLDTRARNLAVDLNVVQLLAENVVNRAALGQDDAGQVGLHIKDVAALEAAVARAGVGGRISIEPGADELGMALTARALARQIRWTPRIAVHYSTPSGADYLDPLEFAPISVAINGLIELCGGIHADEHPDITLFVRVPHTDAAADAVFLAAIKERIAEHSPAAVADLTFLEISFVSQARFAKTILDDGTASALEAYSSWNTNANTVGTALAESIAAGTGRRAHRYGALAHAEFTFNRFVDDYAFHDFVRPDLNRWLNAQGITDHTYLLPQAAASTADRNNALLWNDAAALLAQLYPQYHIAAIRLDLPWDRTFETGIDAALAPGLPR